MNADRRTGLYRVLQNRVHHTPSFRLIAAVQGVRLYHKLQGTLYSVSSEG